MQLEIFDPGRAEEEAVKSLWNRGRKSTQSLYLFTLIPFLWGYLYPKQQQQQQRRQ